MFIQGNQPNLLVLLLTSTYPDSENFLDGPGGPIDKWALGTVSNFVMNEMVTQEILQDCVVFLQAS